MPAPLDSRESEEISITTMFPDPLFCKQMDDGLCQFFYGTGTIKLIHTR